MEMKLTKSGEKKLNLLSVKQVTARVCCTEYSGECELLSQRV